MADNSTKILYIVTCAISFCIYVPLAFHGIARYQKYYKHILMRKRYSNLSMFHCIFMFISIIIGAIQLICIPYAEPEIIKTNLWILSLSLLIIQCYLFTCRIYLNCFDINHSIATENNEWKQLINTSSASTNWFITHKATYGNVNYWVKFICSISILTVIVMYCSMLIDPNKYVVAEITTIVVAVIDICIIAIIRYHVWKLKFYDNIGFGQEIQISLYFGGISITVTLIIQLLSWFLFPSSESVETQRLAAAIFVVNTDLWLWIHMHTHWVIGKHKKWLTQDFESHSLNYLDHEVFADKNNDLSQRNLTLKTVLLDENGFPA